MIGNMNIMKPAPLAIALVLAACRIAPVPFGSDSSSGQSLARRSEFAEKVVNIKRSPLTFIARDGSRCQVDEQTWRDIRVGEKATCMWEFTR
jgi:hypothetical protein